MDKIIIWEFKLTRRPQWQPVIFCEWLAVGNEAGAVIEVNGKPMWRPLEDLLLVDPFSDNSDTEGSKTREIL